MKKYRLGQSREAEDLDQGGTYSRERGGESKRRQRRAGQLETGIESHDAETLLRLPEAEPWMHLPEATLVQRHSQWVDLELADRTRLRATLGGKLKGVRLVCGDRVRYLMAPLEGDASTEPPASRGEGASPEAQVVAVMPRKTLLKRGGIDDREPWQLICANADELWICAAVVDPPAAPRPPGAGPAAGPGCRAHLPGHRHQAGPGLPGRRPARAGPSARTGRGHS